MKYREDDLKRWIKPPSDTEEEKLENSKRMVEDAIGADEKLKYMPIEVFAQGSYANDTNVRLDSDIDINVMYKGFFLYDLPKNTTKEQFEIKDSAVDYTFRDFKSDVENALANKFGRNNVKRKDKCLNIIGNTYRVQTDVVPTFEYKRFYLNNTYCSGTVFYPDSNLNSRIINFPKQHITNGKEKNKSTQRLFKRLTRLHKKLRYKMIEEKARVNNNITSFLLESLVYNIPENTINNCESWVELLAESIVFIHNKDKEKWLEVSELLYLFHDGRKWSINDVVDYMKQLWKYLELGDG